MYATAAAEASYLGDQGSRNNLMVFASHLYLQASHQPLVRENYITSGGNRTYCRQDPPVLGGQVADSFRV